MLNLTLSLSLQTSECPTGGDRAVDSANQAGEGIPSASEQASQSQRTTQRVDLAPNEPSRSARSEEIRADTGSHPRHVNARDLYRARRERERERGRNIVLEKRARADCRA